MAPADAPASQLEQLPRGRHGLPPETVVESQRSRILTAMVEVTAKRGYADCRIADVIAYAGVSRKTFYELFSDKEDCFLAAYDLWLARLFSVTAEAFDSPGDEDSDWADRVRVALAAFLEFIAEHPAAAGFCIVEVLAAGPKALARRDAGVRQFTHFVDAGRAETSVHLPGITALAIVGGIHELLYSEIIHGATAQLPGRLPELVFWMVHPFLGPERAIARASCSPSVPARPLARSADSTTAAAAAGIRRPALGEQPRDEPSPEPGPGYGGSLSWSE